MPEIDQGNFTDYPVGARVPHGLEINITCEAKFDVGYNVTPVTCNNGTWTHVPSCVPGENVLSEIRFFFPFFDHVI